MRTFNMKKIFFSAFVVSLSSLVLLSCSAGESSKGTTVPSTLDEANIQVLSQNILKEGDCIAVSGLALAQPLNKSITSSKDTTENGQEVKFREPHSLSSTVYGLLGGSVSKDGEHNNGTDSLTYKFDDFTNPSGNAKFAVSGSASVIDHGKPGDYGPIMTNKTINTDGKLNVTKSSYSRATSAHYECDISGYNQVYAKVLFSQDDLEIKGATALNTDTGAVYRIENFTSKGYFTNDQIVLTDVKTAYTDPNVGTVEVTSDLLKVSRDSMQIPSAMDGTLILKATDGTEAELVITQSGNIKVYAKGDNGRALVSELDCSGLVH